MPTSPKSHTPLTSPYYTPAELAAVAGTDERAVLCAAQRALCSIDTRQKPFLIRNDRRLARALRLLLDGDERAHARRRAPRKEQLRGVAPKLR